MDIKKPYNKPIPIDPKMDYTRDRVFKILVITTVIISVFVLLTLSLTQELFKIPPIHLIGFSVPYILIIVYYFAPYRITINIIFVVLPFAFYLISCRNNDYGELNFLWVFLILGFYFIDGKLNIVLYLIYIFVLILLTHYYWITNINRLETNILLRSVNVIVSLLIIGFGILFMKHYSYLQQKAIIEKRISLMKENFQKQDLLNIINSKLNFSISKLEYNISNNTNIEAFTKMLPALKSQSEETYKLLDNILHWMKVEISNAQIPEALIDIHYETHEIMDELESIIDDKDLAVEFEMEKLKIFSDKKSFQIILYNTITHVINDAPTSATIIIKNENKNNKNVFTCKWLHEADIKNQNEELDIQLKISQSLIQRIGGKLENINERLSKGISLEFPS